MWKYALARLGWQYQAPEVFITFNWTFFGGCMIKKKSKIKILNNTKYKKNKNTEKELKKD